LPPERPVLGFDTSAAHCAAGLFLGDGRAISRCETMLRGQAERLIPMLEELLAEAGLVWRDLAAIGVGIGPGNFTGVRISVSAARGLALGLGIPAIGVSNFALLARGHMDTAMLLCLPAPRGAVYVQLFRNDLPAAAPELLPDDTIPERLRALRDIRVIGHDAGRLAARLGLPDNALDRALDPKQAGSLIAEIAAEKHAEGDLTLPRPAPLYVRPADAAPMRDSPPLILP
jgi:tRNA threonylcarbamoyl adenosine modification protein YeaZ